MKKVFTANSHNKNKKIGIQVTFILEIKLEKYIFYQSPTIFSTTYSSILNSC